MTGVVATRVATRSGFFLYMSLGFLAIALIGFSTTFVLPLAGGTFVAPPVVSVHGALLFGWLIFFIAQASLIRVRNVSVHRRLGWLGALLGMAIVISGAAVSFYSVRRQLAAGGSDLALSAFVNNLTGFLEFGSLAAAAVVLRRDTESHKRLLLLATIPLLGAAWSRFDQFFSAFENDLFFFFIALSPLWVAVARDLRAYKRVHPVYIWVGGLMVTVATIQLFAFRSAAWLRVGRWLLGEAAV